MTISLKRTDYSNFTWERQKFGTIRILSRRTGVRYFWYGCDRSWHRSDFRFATAAEAVVYDPRDFSRTTPE